MAKTRTRPSQRNGPESEDKPSYEIPESVPLQQQAEPHLLATVKFPIDCVTAQWKDGSNRPINQTHKRRLCRAFQTPPGLLRTDPQHRLRLACRKSEVRKMMDALEREGFRRASQLALDPSNEYPSFMNWAEVVGTQVEMMAGHHRVAALKDYLEAKKAGPAERWWICDVYDQG